MLFLISGPSSVGKSIIVDCFIKRRGFKRIVPYTTRLIRKDENEIDGVEYNFRDANELIKISNNFTLGYWDFPFNHIYGYSEEIVEAIFLKEKYIVLATTKIARSIKNDFPEVVIIFIDFKTKKELIRRITERFMPDINFVNEKIINAYTERANKKYYDIKLENNDPYKIFDMLGTLI